ncbi:MAG: DUF3667 domain-containing protein [Bacteriovoracaceae bacterium]
MRTCLNCGTELRGEYCSSCGQRDKNIHIPVKELVSEFIDALPSFDQRLVRSMIPFLFKPGMLSEAYLSGKRKQYVSPFKFYFFISVLFFFVNSVYVSESKSNLRNNFSLRDSVKTIMKGDSSNNSIRSSNSEVSFTIADTAKMQKLFGKKFIEGFTSGQNNPQMFFEKIKEHLPKIIFLLLPVFALLLKLVYLRSNILYIKHLIFSFYFHSFVFFILLVDTIGEMVLPKDFHLYGNIMMIVIPIYLYYGLINVYKQTRWKTVMKFLLLSLSHIVIFLITLSLFVVATVILFFT